MKRWLLLLFLTACAPPAATPSAALPEVVSVYVSPAAEPWLKEVYACGTALSIVIRLSAAESAADIRLRLGEPKPLNTPAYRIGAEDILVVTQRASPLQTLTAEQARALFSEGQENVEIWVYASSADIQEIFEREVMLGRRIHNAAQLILHPLQFVDALHAESSAAGLLPRRWTDETMREIFRLENVPVLAIPLGEPHMAVKKLIGCLQQ